MGVIVIVVIVIVVIVVTGGKQSQLLASALGLGWSLTKSGFKNLKLNFILIRAPLLDC